MKAKRVQIVRETRVFPGWHCRKGAPCSPTCRGEGDHGIHTGTWLYVVKGARGDEVLTLSVSSGIYPSSAMQPDQLPEGTDLTLHVTYPTSLAQMLDGALACAVVRGGHCHTWSSSVLAAREFWEKYGTGARTIGGVSEEFWLQLEAIFQEKRQAAREARCDLTHDKCPICGGTGIRRRPAARKAS
jgi:hypothetical protein